MFKEILLGPWPEQPESTQMLALPKAGHVLIDRSDVACKGRDIERERNTPYFKANLTLNVPDMWGKGWTHNWMRTRETAKYPLLLSCLHVLGSMRGISFDHEQTRPESLLLPLCICQGDPAAALRCNIDYWMITLTIYLYHIRLLCSCYSPSLSQRCCGVDLFHASLTLHMVKEAGCRVTRTRKAASGKCMKTTKSPAQLGTGICK